MARSIPQNRRLPRSLAITDELCRLALIALQREQVVAIALNPSRGCPVARVRVVHRRLQTSARRYEQFGRARVTLIYGLIAALYACRVPLPLLAAIYAKQLPAVSPTFPTHAREGRH